MTRRHSARPALVALAPATLALLLAACGGGGGDAGGTASGLSAADAQAASANGLQGGGEGSASIDRAFDLTQALVTANAAAMTTAFRSTSLAAANGSRTRTATAPVTSATVPCVGGGSATLTISGGTLLTQLNGQFDPGEHYELAFAGCGGSLGLVQLDGQLAMDIVSVSSNAPVVTTAGITLTGLKVTVRSVSGTASATLDGQATVARTLTTTSTVTTASSHVTATRLSMATAWNDRSGSFTITNLDTVHTTTWLAGALAGSSLAGHHQLTGTANGRAIDESVSVQGEVDFDAQGTPVSGTWISVRPDATVTTTVANGVVTLVVDDGNDGTVDHTWTLTPAQWQAAAG